MKRSRSSLLSSDHRSATMPPKVEDDPSVAAVSPVKSGCNVRDLRYNQLVKALALAEIPKQETLCLFHLPFWNAYT
jgi:hypothetical protein